MPEITEVTIERGTVGQADGGVLFGAVGMAMSPPRLVLAVATPGGETRHQLLLGETFLVGGDTWRFEDAEIADPDTWTATLRFVPPGAPPYRPPAEPRDYLPVDLRGFGTVDEAGIAQLEQHLGRRLPPHFRQWLAQSNGAAPVENVSIPGTYVTLGPFQPILGVHPDHAIYDIRHAERQAGRWFTDDYVVIAIGLNGYVAVRIRPPGTDHIVILREAEAWQEAHRFAAHGYPTEAEYLCAEHLMTVAEGIGAFCALLRPEPPLPPATAL